MSFLVYLALFGWLIVAVAAFLLLKPSRAIVACFVGGSLLLPKTGIQLADGLPSWDSSASTSWFALLCAFCIAPRPILAFRPHWFDLVIVASTLSWSLSPALNGLGIQQYLIDLWWYLNWATIPYFLARCYINQASSLIDVSMGLAIGLILYMPLVLWEIRFSPQLNHLLYDFYPASFANTKRWGGFRPSVFFSTGLALCLWTCLGTLVVWSLWLAKSTRSLLHIPVGLVVAATSVVAVLCKGTGALLLLLFGLIILTLVRYFRATWPLHIVPAMILVYIITGIVGSDIPARDMLVEAIRLLPDIVDPERRAGSLSFRFIHEEALAERARERLFFGWGGFGLNRVYSARAIEVLGVGRVVTDGFWVIVLGTRGVVGTLAVYAWMLAPGMLAIRALRSRPLDPRLTMLVSGLYLWTSLYAADLLLNGFISPVQGLIAGSLVAFSQQKQQSRRFAGRSSNRESRLLDIGTPRSARPHPSAAPSVGLTPVVPPN